MVVERRVSKPASPRAPVLYQISGTAASCYNATHQIVVTNGAFTEPARRWAHDPRHRVHLIDRDRLSEWLAGSPILELLRVAAHSNV